MRQYVAALCLLAMTLPLAAVAADDYSETHNLGAGDVISIVVYDEPDLSMKIAIDKTGMFEYPFLGHIRAAGKTTRQLQSEIESGLRDGYLVDPQVTLVIQSYRPYFINGQVRKPSAYPYTPGMTVIKAITRAGGYTVRAAKDKVLIQRENSTVTYRARLDSPIRPGDIITVKESLF